jgi:ornithine carbamoyltransferase
MKDLLRSADLTPGDLELLLDLSDAFKADPGKAADLLRGETVLLYFNKPSTRTRISFETAVARLGGVPVSVGANDLQLGRGETIEDTALTISRYARAFVIRTFSDEDVRRFAAAATIPVINALTDGHHPCQSLADLMTLREKRGSLTGQRIAYVGDGNNVTHSLLEAAALSGVHIAVATPEGYDMAASVVTRARQLAKGTDVIVTRDPKEAVKGADCVYTDVWLSMGDPPDQRGQRLSALKPYQVNSKLMAGAKADAIFMHCLPQHQGEEVTSDVAEGPNSVIFDQAENRLHTSVALLYALIEGQLKGA